MRKKIAHISDPHVTDRESADRFLALVRKMIMRYAPERWTIIITGDLVDHGNPEEFDLVNEGLSLLRIAGFRVYIVPGNHDYGAHGIFYSSKAHLLFLDLAEEIQGIREYPFKIDLDGARLLFLDSTAHNEEGEPFARGRIGARQIAWIETHLADEIPQWIVLHHHATWRNPFLAISDAEDLQAVVDRRDNVSYLCGHRHAEDLELIAAGKFTECACVIEVDPISGSAVTRSLDRK